MKLMAVAKLMRASIARIVVRNPSQGTASDASTVKITVSVRNVTLKICMTTSATTSS